VGAVLAQGDKIIAEGWHKRFGGPHAEVEALAAAPADTDFSECTLYVSLEPCCHRNKKTPPCTDLILEKGISHVVIGTPDPNPEVSGRGVETLRAAGVQVEVAEGAAAAGFRALIRPFRVRQQFRRPYITLKWAETANGNVGTRDNRLIISNLIAQRHSHSLRAQHQGIAVGAGTWLADAPQLDTRLYPGPTPRRFVITHAESNLAVPETVALLHPGGNWPELFKKLYTQEHIGSLLVEGGPRIHQQLLDLGLWDELYIYHNPDLITGDIPAARLPAGIQPEAVAPLGNCVVLHTFAPWAQ
jgi:diaminohydroxyphosphoribosylaminopyrimidine deaminase/5-amino-6-(5-phosphoribosylamino)uracil reductase